MDGEQDGTSTYSAQAGGAGRNLIIGGKGADTLTGGPSGDILIRDCTDYDANIATLDAIMAEWDSGDSYAMRYSFITAPAG